MPELLAESYPLWAPEVPFPASEAMEDLAVVTHVAVERAQPGGYHYLHESAIAWHEGVLHLLWANHRTAEVNVKDELLRGRRSTDGGLTWEAAQTIAAAPENGAESYNHPVLASHQGQLWGFFTRWDAARPSTEVRTYDSRRGKYAATGARLPEFVPFCPPQRLPDGNWIMGGELYWYEAAVAISAGDDWGTWRTVPLPRPEAMKLVFPETALLQVGGEVVAVCRPNHAPTAPVAVSKDCGQSWTTLGYSNLPLAASQPYGGRLSTGQNYLIFCNHEQGRTLLQIAVTPPDQGPFCRVWKLRHQAWPKVRLFGGWGEGSRVGQPTEWSYPAAVEHEGNLYISYTQGKEDCCLSIVPIRVLAV
ncbi:MAG: exo-alpha-sialidase [Armatimonadetes bacterium]|nr:exo-alpha-sialidase [Armatimonadota bacterium]